MFLFLSSIDRTWKTVWITAPMTMPQKHKTTPLYKPHEGQIFTVCVLQTYLLLLTHMCLLISIWGEEPPNDACIWVWAICLHKHLKTVQNYSLHVLLNIRFRTRLSDSFHISHSHSCWPKFIAFCDICSHAEWLIPWATSVFVPLQALNELVMAVCIKVGCWLTEVLSLSHPLHQIHCQTPIWPRQDSYL